MNSCHYCRLIITLVLCTRAVTCAFSAETDVVISVSVKAASRVVVSGEPINVKVSINNKGPKPATIFEPSMRYTLLIDILSGGKDPIVLSQISSAFVPIEKEMLPGKTVTIDYDANQLFPCGLEPGMYTMRARYIINRTTIVSSSEIALEVKALPKDETDALQLYKKVACAGEHSDVVTIGKAFLKNYPNSIFAHRARMETAFALRRVTNFVESIRVYKDITDAANAPQWIRQEAQWQMAHTLYEKGDVKHAIEEMKKLSTPAAAEQVQDWESPEPTDDQ